MEWSDVLGWLPALVLLLPAAMLVVVAVGVLAMPALLMTGLVVKLYELLPRRLSGASKLFLLAGPVVGAITIIVSPLLALVALLSLAFAYTLSILWRGPSLSYSGSRPRVLATFNAAGTYGEQQDELEPRVIVLAREIAAQRWSKTAPGFRPWRR